MLAVENFFTLNFSHVSISLFSLHSTGNVQTSNSVYEIVSDMATRQDSLEEKLAGLEDKLQGLQVSWTQCHDDDASRLTHEWLANVQSMCYLILFCIIGCGMIRYCKQSRRHWNWHFSLISYSTVYNIANCNETSIQSRSLQPCRFDASAELLILWLGKNYNFPIPLKSRLAARFHFSYWFINTLGYNWIVEKKCFHRKHVFMHFHDIDSAALLNEIENFYSWQQFQLFSWKSRDLSFFALQ